MEVDSKYTDRVTIMKDYDYVVWVNGKAAGYVKDLALAKKMMVEIIEARVKLVASDKLKLFKQELNDGLKIVLSSQKLGRLWNSSLKNIMKIEIEKVPILSYS